MLQLLVILSLNLGAPLLAQAAPAAQPPANAVTTQPAAASAPAGPVLSHYERGGDFFMPPRSSTVAGSIDWIYYFIFWICVFFFVLIVVLMFWFAMKYRRRGPAAEPLSSTTHNTSIELLWSVIPTLLCVPMFWWGFKGYMDVRNPPANSYEVQVQAQRWSWSFIYPNGTVTDELHVPAGKPVTVVLNSSDVLHSFYVPDFRVKMDVVPGRYNKTWFQANQPGEHVLVCAEYCGKDHSIMASKVVVEPAEAFPAWLEKADPIKQLSDEEFAAYQADSDAFIAANKEKYPRLQKPADMGRKIYTQICISCHTLDGTRSTGPSFQGVWGRHEKTNAGDVIVNEEYVQESLWEPNAKIVDTYTPGMPTFKSRFGSREIRVIIEFLKTVK
jgi:cytochrome c oxidase subunit II